MKRNFAFTLAEVLITIGIVGIISALTIPSLISTYNKKVTGERLKKAYSELVQAVKLSEVENGDVSGWNFGLSSEEFAKTYLFPFVKIQKSNPRLLNLKYKNLNNADYNYDVAQSSDTTVFVTMSGTMFFVDAWIPGDKKYRYIGVDINGINGPNIVGKDYFIFVIDSDFGVRTNGYTLSLSDLKTRCKSNGGACAAWIQKNNWKIPKDYPW